MYGVLGGTCGTLSLQRIGPGTQTRIQPGGGYGPAFSMGKDSTTPHRLRHALLECAVYRRRVHRDAVVSVYRDLSLGLFRVRRLSKGGQRDRVHRKGIRQVGGNCGMMAHASDIQAHITLGVRKRYYHHVRRVYMAVLKKAQAIQGPYHSLEMPK